MGLQKPSLLRQRRPTHVGPDRYVRWAPETQPSIFVSYAHEESGLAHALAKAMESEGANCRST